MTKTELKAAYRYNRIMAKPMSFIERASVKSQSKFSFHTIMLAHMISCHPNLTAQKN